MMRLAAADMQKLEPLPHGERGVIISTASVAAYVPRLPESHTSNEQEKGPFITFETLDHCCEHRGRVQSLQVEPMPGSLGQQDEVRKLRAPVALAKRVDGVQVGKEARGAMRERRGVQPVQMAGVFQTAEQFPHLRVDVLGVAEHAVALGYANGSNSAGPTVNVLKEMPMNGSVVRIPKLAAR
jgi:hypothetical protein